MGAAPPGLLVMQACPAFKVRCHAKSVIFVTTESVIAQAEPQLTVVKSISIITLHGPVFFPLKRVLHDTCYLSLNEHLPGKAGVWGPGDEGVLCDALLFSLRWRMRQLGAPF